MLMISLTSHFIVNKFEVECLIKLFNNLGVEPSERHAVVGLDRNSFRNILHVTFGMTDDMIMDRGEAKSIFTKVYLKCPLQGLTHMFENMHGLPSDDSKICEMPRHYPSVSSHISLFIIVLFIISDF